jgi:outer membrane protein assembly factor BamB
MVLCLDDRNGALQWRKNDLGTYHMLARDGILYTRSHMVQAFNGEDGTSLWTRHAAGCSPLQFAHDCLVYTEAGAEKAVVALNAQTGNIAARLDVENSCTGILLAEGMGFISSNDGVLRALRVTS